MLGTREEAEDAVQQTFIAAYRDLAKSTKPIQLRAWLYAIARNRCLSMLRGRRERPLDAVDEPVTAGLAEAVQQRQDLRDLVGDIGGLPDDQRAALVLAELGDLSHEDIASVLDCPRDKVKALVFQARTSLQSSRDARETSCDEVRELLANLRGGSLRRSTIRRHVRECEGCRDFQTEVGRQRRAMAVVLPVAPTLGLKHSALAAIFGGSGTAGVVTATGVTGVLVAKIVVVGAIATGGAAGVKVVTHDPPSKPARTTAPRTAGAPGPAAPAGAAPISTTAATPTPASGERKRRQDKSKRDKASAEDHGKEQDKAEKKATDKDKNKAEDKSKAKAKAKDKAKTPKRAKDPKAAKLKRDKKAKAKPKPKPTPAARHKPRPPKTKPKPHRTPAPTPAAATPEPRKDKGRADDSDRDEG